MIYIFVVMFIFFFFGMPIAFGILSSTIYYLLFSGQTRELLAFSTRVISASDSYVLLAVPFFMLAAELMNEAKITDRIFSFAKSLVGHIPGGLGHVNIMASIIFAGMSGSGLADTSGLGKVEIKAMKDEGYDPAFSAAVTASSAIIGPIIPPSICMVVGAVVTNTSVGRMLVGGIIPGFMMGTSLMVLVYFLSKKRGYPKARRATVKEIWKQLTGTGPALLTPLILVGGILSGVFTPTEAAAVACIYAMILAMIFYRAFGVKRLFRIFVNVGTATGALLFVMSAASALGTLASRAQVPQNLMKLVMSITSNPTVTMFIIVGVLILLGMIMEDLSLLVIMGPLLLPVVLKLGINPVHFGVVMVLTLQLAMITPPVGMGFYITCHLADVDAVTYSKEIIWFVMILIVVVVLMCFIPSLVTFLPDLFFGK
ncbi:MAG: TRAP transporter large permease [Deltaproteobacteria bacterium]|nr:TRAP transporter large permease [Deltaproteobacteria bacterium]